MATVYPATIPDDIRAACQIADAEEVIVYDADFPDEAGQQFVEAVVRDSRGHQHHFNLTEMDWSELSGHLHAEASELGETVKFVLDLGPADLIELMLKIENVYPDGTIKNTKEILVPDAPTLDLDADDELVQEWAFAWLYPHTGTGRTEGDAGYFVEIIGASRKDLVGREFEWGI